MFSFKIIMIGKIKITCMRKHFCFSAVAIIIGMPGFVRLYTLFYFIIVFCIIKIYKFFRAKKRMTDSADAAFIKTKSKYIAYAFIEAVYNILYFCFYIAICSIYI